FRALFAAGSSTAYAFVSISSTPATRSFDARYIATSFIITRTPPASTLFPYTTLFRSHRGRGGGRDRLSRVGRIRLHDRREIGDRDRKSTRLNSSHVAISYAVFCSKKKNRGRARGGDHSGPLHARRRRGVD